MRRNNVKLNFSNIRSTEELHNYLRKKFRFPKWYGCNWNAFYDAITTIVEMPRNITIVGMNHLVTTLPRDAKAFRSCINDYNQLYKVSAINVIIEEKK